MVRASTTTACIAIWAATILAAGAQMSTNSQTWAGASVAADGAAQGGQLQPGQLRASKILGGAIYTAGNTKIGKVAELIIDKDGRVAGVIVDVAFVGLGKKSVAVDLGDISGADNHLILDRSIDELQQMASYRLEPDKDGAGTSLPNLGGQLTAVPAQ